MTQIPMCPICECCGWNSEEGSCFGSPTNRSCHLRPTPELSAIREVRDLLREVLRRIPAVLPDGNLNLAGKQSQEADRG